MSSRSEASGPFFNLLVMGQAGSLAREMMKTIQNAVVLVALLALAVPSVAQEPRFDPAIQNPRLLTQNALGLSPWDNAEAYFSADGKRLIFQASRDGRSCDAMYTMDVDGHRVRMISTGTGRTTCGYFSPDGRWLVYASTHGESPECPKPPDMSRGYTWAVYPSYDIYRVPAEGGQPERLSFTEGYDAEAVYRPDGKKILFTSTRDGDLDLYDMDPDGGNVRRLSDTPGYDGGAFYTQDSRSIVFRSRHPEGEELEDYQRLLANHQVRPSKLDLFVMDADGGNLRQVTFDGERGATSWAPYPHPDGKRIVYASNRDDFDITVPGQFGFNFELYIVGVDGTGLRRLTYNESFDGFPMFSNDGRRLVWCGNYVAARPRDTDVILADWRESARIGP